MRARSAPPPPNDADPISDVPASVPSFAADDVALAALSRRPPEPSPTCHACDGPIEGSAPASGLFVWARGDGVQVEEPPLCEACATAIGMSQLRRWDVEDEEG